MRSVLRVSGLNLMHLTFYQCLDRVLGSYLIIINVFLKHCVFTSGCYYDLQITHPAGCFPQFVKFFGEHIFVLWKFVLLQKRILFFSPPPVGVACYRGGCVIITHVL